MRNENVTGASQAAGASGGPAGPLSGTTAERHIGAMGGFGMLFLVVLVIPAIVIAAIVHAVPEGGHASAGNEGHPWFAVGAVGLIGLDILLMVGFFSVQPNTSRVLVLFGRYVGTVRDGGFRWASPFMTKKAVSLRAHTLNGEKLKVNDKSGNPIEIAAVVVWRVRDTAQAVFDVENYVEFVQIQSETAVRHLASTHPYDGGNDEEPSLRGSGEKVSSELQTELAVRLARAGIEVLEARLSHLAYAPEIAGAALRNEAAAVALSIVYPEDDPQLARELTDLAGLLPASTRILAGGRAARSYFETLVRIGALYAESLEELGNALEQEIPEIARLLIDCEPSLESDDAFLATLSLITLHAPSFSLRGGTREIMRGMIARGLGIR